MGLGLQQSRYHARRRQRSRFFRWILLLGGVAVLGVVSYRSGSELAKRDVRRLEARVQELNDEVGTLRLKNAQLAGESGASPSTSSRKNWRRASRPTGCDS